MRRINSYLNKQLAIICENAMQLEGLNILIKNYLPERFSEYCKVASFNRGCLILSTANAGFATELRYLVPELRDKLRKDAGLYQLTTIKISIDENQLPERIEKITPPNLLSDGARSIIRTASEECVYEPLKKALEDLAGNSDVIG